MKKIEFKKWVDPLGETYKLLDSEEERPWESELESLGVRGKPAIGKFVVGPMGIIPVGEKQRPSASYNLWVGHTNFDLTEPVFLKLEQVPGVEVLQVFTRYRFWLGVGDMFDPDDVHEAIRERLCDEPDGKRPGVHQGVE